MALAGLRSAGGAGLRAGGPRVEISADRLAPGLVLEVRGVNIAADESIAVSLVGVAGQFPLGVVIGGRARRLHPALHRAP